MTSPPRLSPNHLDRRQRIVDAAKQVLLSGGPSACTSRAVAERTEMNKALIHYYFATMDEIVDTAMGQLLDDIVISIRTAADEHVDPEDRFWAVVQAYLETFEGRPGLTLLWFDYWVLSARVGRSEMLDRIQESLIELLASLLGETGASDADTRARALFSYVVGTLVRRENHPVRFEELRPEIATLCDIRPSGRARSQPAR